MLKSISIQGFRGFAKKQELLLAEPNGDLGSGLTVLVGPNSCGKSTIIESFRLLAAPGHASFTEGKRNKLAGDRVEIEATFTTQESIILRTAKAGGSETELDGNAKKLAIYFLPSRRVFSPYFNKNRFDRKTYIERLSSFNFREQGLDSFSCRLFNALNRKDEFNLLMAKILGYELDWTIDQNDSGQYYVKLSKPQGIYHSSDGLGEGVISLMFLVDALFESTEDEVIVFDEPELSLHPQLQRRLLKEILNYTRTRQVVYATHSPEMVSIESLVNGGTLARITSIKSESRIFQLSENGRKALEKLTKDFRNPHLLGYDARACFFEDDRLVIVEGQEDVMYMNRALEKLSITSEIRFFGYGAGGAEKIQYIAAILQELGYEKVCCLYDGDKKEEAKKTAEKFQSYSVKILNADDIRDKTRTQCVSNDQGEVMPKEIVDKVGIFDSKQEIKDNYKKDLQDLLNQIIDEIYT